MESAAGATPHKYSNQDVFVQDGVHSSINKYRGVNLDVGGSKFCKLGQFWKIKRIRELSNRAHERNKAELGTKGYCPLDKEPPNAICTF